MEKTTWDKLVFALENLPKEKFKRFKERLNQWETAGYGVIPWSQLQDKDAGDVATRIISHYTEHIGIKVTLGVLLAIGEKNAHKRLAHSLGVGNFMNDSSENMERGEVTAPRPAPNGAHQVTVSSAAVLQEGGDHFIDSNRVALIRRMSDTNIMLVLDELLSEKILNDVQYNTVQSCTTSHEMMRKIYDYMRSWGHKEKERLFFFISKHDNCLIMDLMEQESHSLNS
ncbi:apoptosis-associated speck-like protein containing a CARD [Xenopus laevis]|uniref:Apoptosis-associated speck-like protein containing a CARD n=1 Tax=Xenopus laevis TaxID=8355 RepID=A0A8J1LT41_XENLA|nr:apoptosis-associated speck-like protein containing a CARD [Xenopus laevis]OCT59026.1 hypothetical protein XELAEV_18001516mg [Xenopus laevis]